MIVRPPKVCGALPIGLMRNQPLDFSLLENDLPVASPKKMANMFQSKPSQTNDVLTGSDDDLLNMEKLANLKADAELAALSGGNGKLPMDNQSQPEDKPKKSCNVQGCGGGSCNVSRPVTPSLKVKDEQIPTEEVSDRSYGRIEDFEKMKLPPQKATEIINNFAERKIVDYLKTGQYKKVLIRFHHGLGDTVLFYASGGIDKLREMFPDIEIAFHTALGQEEIFGSVDNDVTHYDIVFEPRMPLSEWDKEPWNKAEKCLHVEFGIPVEFGRSVWKLPNEYGNRLIGFHFHSTCMRNLTVNEASALKVWQYVQNKGFVALSTHMRHKNNHTTLYRFESSNVIDEPARVSKLFGLIKACAGFAGTASGNFHSALALLPPEKILFLKTDFNVNRITHLPVRQLDVRDANKIDFGVVDDWLADVVR